jgi:hypothetical protein
MTTTTGPTYDRFKQSGSFISLNLNETWEADICLAIKPGPQDYYSPKQVYDLLDPPDMIRDAVSIAGAPDGLMHAPRRPELRPLL